MMELNLYATRLRDLAAQIRDADFRSWNRVELGIAASELIAEASRRGMLNALPELRRFVEWIDGESPPPEGWRENARTVGNVLYALVGRQILDMRDGKVEAQRIDGILPCRYPEVFRQDQRMAVAQRTGDQETWEGWSRDRQSLEAIACELLADALEAGNRTPEAKPQLIKANVAEDRYHVTRSTLKRAVRDGKLTDHRPKGHATNAPLLLDENEIAGSFQPK